MKQTAINKCMEISEDPYRYLKNLKEGNEQKIISCFAMHIPEELIHAAGMLPVIAWRSNESVTSGHSHVAPYNCGLTRSYIDDIVKGKLDFIDGIVVHRMCLQAQGLPFILEQNIKLPFLVYLSLPALYGGKAVHDFLLEEIERLKTSLEEYAGRKITTEELNKSIEIYNKNRKLLSEIYDIRRENPGIIKARELLSVVHSSMLMPKEDNNDLLQKVIDELKARKVDEKTVKGLKVIIYGSLCQTPHRELLDMIEELGMIIVDDDIFIGSKYFANQVSVGSNPVQALADRYLQKNPPCPTKGDLKTDWTDYLIEMAEKNQAKAILSFMIKYCPPHMCCYPDIKNKLERKGIPEILIEVEHEVISIEQVRTRLQSFIENIGGV